MKRLAGLSALAVIISSTSGCGWLWGEHGYFRDRGNDYLEARRTAPMNLPEGVATSKRLDPLLPIPRNVADDTALNDYDVPRPQPLSVVAESGDFTLQKSAASRWILAQRPPAEAWPVARQFFEDNGFRIDQESVQTGEFTTAWQSFDSLSSDLGQRLRGGSDVNGDIRLQVRVEPGVQRNTSEIYVVSAQRPAGSTEDVAFPARTTSGVDATLVDEMLSSLTRGAEKGGSVSLLAARDFDAPSQVAMTEDGSGNPVLTVGADLDRAWSSVGRALEQGGQWRVEDINRSLGLYYINLAEKGGRADDNKPGFFGRLFGHEPTKEELEARADRYQVRLSKVGEAVQVTVEKNINTVAPADVARRVLSVIQDNLG
ncbi:outer membrane protein assembly factor BamC [Pseudomonas japonica]|uniref:outer membrane protein assembly factor BamC n=1 Tax=Pseudomonas japonica TaxID=256466 RepID=UPI0015E2804B|nr:outer membrane protein assembly factor BamC [Pseudomonas japonica]MBA1241820.1 outer membrane protein assembly factor BamC [Pseudomonas japonica]